MKNYLPIVSILFIMLLASCTDNHFINDTEYRNQVHQDFIQRENIAKNRHKELFSIFEGNISTQEKEALEFLYAYMPYSDLADYDGDFFLNQVEYAFKARDFFTWGKSIPEDVFRHFVLVYRVNNENLDTARMVIFNELKDRIKDMSMYDAALEVNHWCHEKVTYQPSDGRTSSPLATIKTAWGRCGEESTFAVTAMRAVGIPARQCYTPRWAHTDDNHAWVEVWVDGKWYFLGACEPDAELNMGWFATPATRTMMVHSNAYGKYKGTEEINHQTNLFSRINMLPNYTDTKKITIKVIDADNNPVENADVKFKLYNYAEYYPIATGKTDKDGCASLTTGNGDLLIWACKDNKYNYNKIDVRLQDSITIILSKTKGKEYVELLDIVPPAALPNKVVVSEEKANLNNLRLKYEDSIRNAYTATFPSQEQAAGIKNENLTTAQIWNFIHKSEGNYTEIEKFIKTNAEQKTGLYLYEFINSLADKDLRDVPADVLQSHLTTYCPDNYPLDVYLKGILPARISLEKIRPWRETLHENFYPTLKDNHTAAKIMDWINTNITVDNEGNYYNCPISPLGVYELRYSDKRSRDIFFVAVCRSMNIPAYLDGATNQLFVYENDSWQPVNFEEEAKPAATGSLILTHNLGDDVKPEYWIHYTIAKYQDGDFVTYDFENDSRVANFPVQLEIESGYYMLSTGNRYSDGTTLSRLEFFNLNAGETVHKEIILRPLTPRHETYGRIDVNKEITISGKKQTLSNYIGKDEIILAFIDPNREPTKHLFKDISAFKKQFEKWNGKILFVIPSDKQTADFNPAQWNLPKQSLFIYDENSKWMNNILTSTNQEFRDNYPLVFIVDGNGELTFKTEGYRIGTGELIYKSLKL